MRISDWSADLCSSDLNEIESFQKAFAATAGELDGGKGATFLAVEETGNRIGYVHVREGSDEVLEEACGYIALLAVEQEHEGRGVAKALVEQESGRGGCRERRV